MDKPKGPRVPATDFVDRLVNTVVAVFGNGTASQMEALNEMFHHEVRRHRRLTERQSKKRKKVLSRIGMKAE